MGFAEEEKSPLKQCLTGVVALSLGWTLACGQAMARASSTTENPWAGEHIEGLPSDIRSAVRARARACGNKAAAVHYFSVSIAAAGARFVSLHFEDFACADRAVICDDGNCLHQLYVDLRGRQRLVFSTRAHDLRMFKDGNTVGIEVLGGPLAGRYRWQGSRFVRAAVSRGR